jgi:hypothetical protein
MECSPALKKAWRAILNVLAGEATIAFRRLENFFVTFVGGNASFDTHRLAVR